MTWAQFVAEFYKWWEVVTFCVAAIFVLYYGLTSPWYKTPFGRSLILLDAGVAVATFPGFLFYIFDIHLMENRAIGITVIAASAAITLGIAYRLLVLWKTRHSKFWKNLNNSRDAQYPVDHSEPHANTD